MPSNLLCQAYPRYLPGSEAAPLGYRNGGSHRGGAQLPEGDARATCTIKEMARTLKILQARPPSGLDREIQGYIKPVNDVWITTIAGEWCRTKRAAVQSADRERGLDELKKRMIDMNATLRRIHHHRCGGFRRFSERARARVQAADVASAWRGATDELRRGISVDVQPFRRAARAIARVASEYCSRRGWSQDTSQVDSAVHPEGNLEAAAGNSYTSLLLRAGGTKNT